MSLEERLRSHYESLSRVIEFTRMADAKAGPVLLVQLALAGTLVARFEGMLPEVVSGVWDLGCVALVAGMFCYALLFVATVGIAALVYSPTSPKAKHSLIYFEDIASSDVETFKRLSLATSTEEIERQLLDQIHRVSQIASAKMSRVRLAIGLSVPSVCLWVTLLLLGSSACP